MGLRDRLHRIEQQGEESLHRGAELARAGVHNLQSKISRKTKARAAQSPMSIQPDPVQEQDLPPQPKVRTGIVSVNGCDVEKMRCTGGKRTA